MKGHFLLQAPYGLMNKRNFWDLLCSDTTAKNLEACDRVPYLNPLYSVTLAQGSIVCRSWFRMLPWPILWPLLQLSY